MGALTSPRVALATCTEIPELEPDDRLLLAALEAHGIDAAPAVWDDDGVDWRTFDLVLLRSTWDYAERRDEFLEWVRRLPMVLNRPSVVDWSTDKERYLTDLEAAGVPIVPTTFVPPGTTLEPPPASFVVKPSVSAGGRSSARFTRTEIAAARVLVQTIHAEGRTAMVQPLLQEHERALVYIDGDFSHALHRRVPLPATRSHPAFYLDEELEPAEATDSERAIAQAALACAPGELLYGRVDLMGGAVLELELAEPSLYFSFGPGSPERFAEAVARRAAASQRLRISPENGRTTSQ